MKRSYANLKIWTLPMFMLLEAIISFPFLQDTINVQWSYDGTVTNTASRWVIFALPVICAALLLVRNIIPVINEKSKKWARKFNGAHFALALFLFAIQNFACAGALGFAVAPSRMIFNMILGIVLVYCGNDMPKFAQYYSFGLKPQINVKTQRLSKAIWTVCGLISMAVSLFQWQYQIIATIILLVLLTVLPKICNKIFYQKA